jgi:hypothetical protein
VLTSGIIGTTPFKNVKKIEYKHLKTSGGPSSNLNVVHFIHRCFPALVSNTCFSNGVALPKESKIHIAIVILESIFAIKP